MFLVEEEPSVSRGLKGNYLTSVGRVGAECLQGPGVGAGVQLLTANRKTHLMIHAPHLPQID